jgi:uncharacterized protein DUF1937
MTLNFTAAPNWSIFLDHADCYDGLLYPNASVSDIVKNQIGGLSYIATPYSNHVTDGSGFRPDLSKACAGVAAQWAATLILHGIMPVSPIVQSAAMADAALGAIDPLDSTFWAVWCSTLLVQCRRVIVPPIPGWDKSVGIFAEAKFALENNRPVYLLADDCFEGLSG